MLCKKKKSDSKISLQTELSMFVQMVTGPSVFALILGRCEKNSLCTAD